MNYSEMIIVDTDDEAIIPAYKVNNLIMNKY